MGMGQGQAEQRSGDGPTDSRDGLRGDPVRITPTGMTDSERTRASVGSDGDDRKKCDIMVMQGHGHDIAIGTERRAINKSRS
jgi:hypothetical protein